MEAAGSDGFRVVSESQAYRRFLQVQDRRVAYPDGRECDFDIGEATLVASLPLCFRVLCGSCSVPPELDVMPSFYSHTVCLHPHSRPSEE